MERSATFLRLHEFAEPGADVGGREGCSLDHWERSVSIIDSQQNISVYHYQPVTNATSEIPSYFKHNQTLQ